MANPPRPSHAIPDLPIESVGARNAVRRFFDRGLLGSPATRVWLFTAFLATAALAGYLLDVRHLEPFESPVHVPWPILAIAYLAAETKVILVHFRRETHSFSLSEVPAVIGLFFVTPNEYLLAVLVGSGVALLVTARESLVEGAVKPAQLGRVGRST